MNTLKVLSAAAALALVLPMTSPSFAQGGPGGARGGGGGAGASMGGGGGASMGGGGGASIGGGGGGAAMRPSTGNFAAGPAARPGGSFAGGMGSRPGISPSYGGSRHIAGGNWHGGGGRHWNHHRRGGFWPGFAAGAAIGGIGSYAYYGSGYGYYDDPYDYGYYDEPSVAIVQDGGGDSAAYCAQRFKSYDPASGTYLGYDGKRHPCP
ncbi:MAG TPA: BA14K family protein [Bradyrhizobium sp.]|nr:BA14K family protein [Bradyrhizobium sp.]